MTVNELIHQLSMLDSEATVLLTWDAECADGVFRVSEETEGAVMDRFGVEFGTGKCLVVLWGDNAD